MNTGRSLLVFGAASCVLLAALIGAARYAPPGWGLAGAPDTGAEGLRYDRLMSDRDRLQRRQEMIRSLREELLEGRLTLREAAAALRAENEGGPRHLDMHVEHWPGRTDEERYCRCVLAHVGVTLGDDPRVPAALRRLQAELRALLGPPAAALHGQ